MGRSPRTYRCFETARMAELEGAPLASFASRLTAFAIDFTLAILSYVVFSLVLIFIAAKFGLVRGHVHFAFDPFHVGESHSDSLISLAYFVAFLGLSNYIGNGATLGKRLMRIRAVSLVHRRLSLWHSIERALGYGASALEAFFGFFQYFIHPNRRTVHDRIAETIVISERKRAR